MIRRLAFSVVQLPNLKYRGCYGIPSNRVIEEALNLRLRRKERSTLKGARGSQGDGTTGRNFGYDQNFLMGSRAFGTSDSPFSKKHHKNNFHDPSHWDPPPAPSKPISTD